MAGEIKALVSKEDTFDKLEIRLGQIIDAELEPAAPKKAYKLTVDFGSREIGRASCRERV